MNKFTDGFTLNEGKISVAGPNGVVLFDKRYPGGLSASIDATIFSFSAKAELALNRTNFYLYGSLSPIDYEHFKLTAFEDASRGPIVELDILYGESSSFFCDSSLTVFGITIGVYSKVNDEGLTFNTKTYFAPFD